MMYPLKEISKHDKNLVVMFPWSIIYVNNKWSTNFTIIQCYQKLGPNWKTMMASQNLGNQSEAHASLKLVALFHRIPEKMTLQKKF